METPLINWESARLDRRPACRVLTRRPMVLRAIDGEPGHVDAGTEIIVSGETLDQLGPGDFELVRRHRPDPPPMASFTVPWEPGLDVNLSGTVAEILR